jgi:hypothetical protein
MSSNAMAEYSVVLIFKFPATKVIEKELLLKTQQLPDYFNPRLV